MTSSTCNDANRNAMAASDKLRRVSNFGQITIYVYMVIINIACISRYWGAECKTRCNENCKTCGQHSGCTDCVDGYYLSNGDCIQCQYRDLGCKCTLHNDCSGCLSGYYEDENRCRKCPINCLECTSLDECVQCVAGLYGKNCEKQCLHGNCFCANANMCDSCKDGFYDIHSKCNRPCYDNCKSCQSDLYNCAECKIGHFGSWCNSNCSVGCRNSVCDKDKGTCICESNYSGSRCENCVPGKYGITCSNDCSLRCVNNVCNKDSGHCPCKHNFAGNACDSCANGYRGTHCDDMCSEGCMHNICTKPNGTCSFSCKPWYYGEYCCLDGKFGYYCNQTCPENCVHCSSLLECKVCKTGFHGAKCEHSCPQNCLICTSHLQCSQCKDGYFGFMCEETCRHICKTCSDSEKCSLCKDGYLYLDKQCKCQKSHCSSQACSSCLNSTYYKYRQACCPCSTNCKNATCSSAQQCTQGCEDGYFDLDCQKKCSDMDEMCMVCTHEDMRTFVCQTCQKGHYPDSRGRCTTCSTSCIGTTCNSLSGHCERGCTDGFWNSTCDVRCIANCSVCDQKRGKCLICSSLSLYGSDCNMRCSNTCANASCHMNGTCASGCISDFFGPSCETPCPTNCARGGNESRCSSENGLCLFGCTEGFTGDVCMHALKKKSNGGPVPTAAIGGGVSAIVIVAIVGAVVLFMYIRTRNREPTHEIVQETSTHAENSFVPVYASVIRNENTGSVHENTSSVNANIEAWHVHNTFYTNNPANPNYSREEHTTAAEATEDSLEIDELDKIARQNAIRFEENGCVYYNNDNEVKKFKTPVAELQKFVMSKNMDYFKTEFEKLPYGLLKDYRVSQLKANIAKNRYKGIYPYDDHRVKVLGGDTDYINASFIDGYKRRNAYIATLGPMSKQLGDFRAFWRMVWQQKVEKIVMVTNLVEEGKDKCEQYWPNAGASQMYGDVRVLCQSEGEFAEFTRRKFTLVKNEEERTLNQLHFTAWPDKDVPEDVTSIIEFRQKVMRAPAVLGGPVLVHCSAGVGRTGTYIALDILTKEGEAEGAINVAGCVLNMRQNRPNMVQTAGQYEYLHHAVVNSLTFDCKPVTGEKFQSYLDRTSKGQIIKMFQQLQGTTKYGSLDETEAVERNAKHTDKNREVSDIPGDEHRPRLYLNRKPGSPDYINAVFVNSFKTKNKYILAQSPLPNPIADFLALIVQSECACIVSFESTSMQAQDVGVYFPADNQVLKKGVFSVRCSKPEANAYRIKRSLTIKHQTNQARNEENSITHMEFTDWNTEQNIPNSPSAFRRFIAEVDAVTSNTNADKPIIIHCMDGASKCGLFCVVATLIQKMEVEHEVSVVNTVRQVKSRRKGAIPSNEQFQFCHDCVLDYIQSFDIYSNFAADLSDC